MSRAIFVLHTDAIRERVADLVRRAPKDSRVEMKGPKRTLPQNDRLHAMVTDIAEQLQWVGERRTVAVWKKLLLDLFDYERGVAPKMLPALHGEGFVRVDGHTSDLTIDEGTEFIEFMFAFGAQHGVLWSGQNENVEAA